MTSSDTTNLAGPTTVFTSPVPELLICISYQYVFAFAGNNGSYGTTCTLKINRASSGPSNPVNVLVQAISSPDMFILN